MDNLPNKMDRSQAIARLWHMGILHWKLEPVQKDLYDAFMGAKSKTVVWACSRRLGKSYALSCIAIEKCLQKPNTIIKFIAPTQKHVKNIIRPLFKQIFNDCPREIRPEFRTADNLFRFNNGSEIQLAGTDSGHAEGLRGGSADLCIVDEAGFCDDLKYIVSSILIPTTTTTRGKIILSSTPPKHFTHEFVDYIQSAKESGNYVIKTIYDGIGTRLPLDEIEKIKEELGGEDSPDFRREYLCELIRDDASTVVPEFTSEIQKEIVKEWPRPPHYDIYVAGDIGFRDFTVFLFAYYDFKMGKIIIEDELVMNGKVMTTDALAEAIKKKERECFTNPISKEQQKPYLRVCDNNLILINDLQALHGLTILPTAKDDSVAALNNMKILLKQGRIIINPRCKTLINHLEFATWNKNQSSFSRFEGHHYDAVDAIKYLCRSVQQNKNPYPANWGNGSGDTWWSGMSAISSSNKPITQSAKVFENVFNIKRSPRSGRK
jgi:hypothetical protein